MSIQRIESTFSIDPGGVHLDTVDAQGHIDRDALANLLFELPSLPENPARQRRNVIFDEHWWVEPTVTVDHELVSLALLASADHIARGALRASLVRVDDAHGSSAHWRVLIDASSVAGPPNYPPRHHVGQREQEASAEGATVVIARRQDGAVEQIDLWLPAAGDTASTDV